MDDSNKKINDSSMRLIFSNAHAFVLNMNDVFYYACADSCTIDLCDLEDMEPLLNEYGYQALVAFEAIKRGHDPQIKDNAENPKFKAAKAELLKLLAERDEYFMFDLRGCLEERPLSVETKKELAPKVNKWKLWLALWR